jgi:short-subunit dehydrogenase
MEKLNFKGKNVLITGASSGIGKEFAIKLADKGANLILTARSKNELLRLAEQLKLKNPNICIHTVPKDLSDPDGATQLFLNISEMKVDVDYLINNAGFGKFCEFPDESFKTYNSMMMLNMHALVELTYLFLPRMIALNSGGIINVASIASFQPLPYQAVYGATKSFVLNFSEALSGELLNSNIRVLALCPGTTESRFMSNANANTSKMKLAPASKVVDDGLEAFSSNKIFKVSGTFNYLQSLIPRIVSRSRTVKIVANMFKDSILKPT